MLDPSSRHLHVFDLALLPSPRDPGLLSWGDEGGWLEESCLRTGLPCLVDPLRFADAAPVLRKGVGAGEHPPLPTVVNPSLPHDALHEARALARTLRWLHARGRL